MVTRSRIAVAAVKRGLEMPEGEAPRIEPKPDIPPGLGPIIELLRVLLKFHCDENEVAQKLIASASDLEALAASDHADIQALKGWRREIFGEEALKLRHGKLALTTAGKKVKVITLD